MIQNHVTNLELSKEMKALGFPQESEFYWSDKDEKGFFNVDFRNQPFYFTSSGNGHEVTNFSAYLSSELGEWFPEGFYVLEMRLQKEKNTVVGIRAILDDNDLDFIEETEPDARAKMLIHLAKEGIIDVKKLK